MTDRLKIAFAQMNQRVGDLDGNAAAMLECGASAQGRRHAACVPELQLTGYPPEDLVLKPEFVRRTMEAAERLVEATAEAGPAMLFGTIVAEGGSTIMRICLPTAAGWSAARSSASCPITAPSTRSGFSRPGRCPSRSSSGA